MADCRLSAYRWTFGDGLSSTNQNPTHTYAVAGTFTANFSVTDGNGVLVNAIPLTIVVTPALSISSSVLPSSGDVPLTTMFSSVPQGGSPAYTYLWTFGDGGTSTLQDPSHTYLGTGTFNASVTVTDSLGATATASGVAVVVNHLPVAGAVPSSTLGDAPATIGFTGSVSGGTGPYVYTWSFGDGATSTTQNPTHIYSSAGTYTASLTVTDADGASASAAAITISVSPALDVTSSSGVGSGNVPLTVPFVAVPTGGRPPYTYAWSFGDGTSSASQNPSHTYTSVGTYSANLTVSDANGGTAVASTLMIQVNGPLAARAGASTLAGDAPVPVTFTGGAGGGTAPYRFSWSFGDGGTSANQDPTYTYTGPGTFTASLTVTDAVGSTATTSFVVIVSPSLGARASVNAASGVVPFAATFTGSAVGGLAPFSFAWSFGDSLTSTSQNPSHTFTAAGTYTVSLTVTDANGVKATAAPLIISTNSPLSASSIAGPQAGDAPLAVGFSSSAAGGVSPYAFAWNFGDGSTSTTQNPSHMYITAGTYTVTLTVTDALSEIASARTLTVSISPELRVTSAVNANSGRTPLAVTFTGTPAGGMAPYTYAWTFGDGATSSVQNPTYTYTSGGTFNANLTITDANHATSSASTLTITAIAALNASAGALPAIGDAPLTTTLNVATSGGQPPYSYSWDLGDGTTSSAGTLSHLYATPGSYTASITVSDGSGQVSHASALITVYSALTGSGSAAPSSGTGSLQVSFSASATGGLRPYTFAWTFGDGVNAATPNGTHVYGPGTFHPTLTIRDSSGGSWSGSVGIITVASPPALVPTPAAIGGQEPSPTAATPVESPSPPSSPSPSATSEASPRAPSAAGTQGLAGGTGGSPIRAWLMVLGSLFAAGLGGTLFRFWIRHRG